VLAGSVVSNRRSDVERISTAPRPLMTDNAMRSNDGSSASCELLAVRQFPLEPQSGNASAAIHFAPQFRGIGDGCRAAQSAECAHALAHLAAQDCGAGLFEQRGVKLLTGFALGDFSTSQRFLRLFAQCHFPSLAFCRQASAVVGEEQSDESAGQQRVANYAGHSQPSIAAFERADAAHTLDRFAAARGPPAFLPRLIAALALTFAGFENDFVEFERVIARGIGKPFAGTSGNCSGTLPVLAS
jgi:hypothetical protein